MYRRYGDSPPPDSPHVQTLLQNPSRALPGNPVEFSPSVILLLDHVHVGALSQVGQGNALELFLGHVGHVYVQEKGRGKGAAADLLGDLTDYICGRGEMHVLEGSH